MLALSPTWGSCRSVDMSSQITGGLPLRSVLAQIYCHCSHPSFCCANGFYVFFVRVFRRRYLLFIQNIGGLKTDKNILRENLNLIIKIAAQQDSTHPEFLPAQISALQWPVSTSKTLTWAPYSCSTVPRNDSRGFLSASDNGREKPKNLLLLISSKIYVHTRLTSKASNPKCSKLFTFPVSFTRQTQGLKVTV